MFSAAVLEITVAGVGAATWTGLLVATITGTGGIHSGLFRDWESLALVSFGGLIYGLGVLVDRNADTAYGRLRRFPQGIRWIRETFGGPRIPFPEKFDLMRLRLLEDDNPRTRFLEYQRSRLRIARSTVFNLVMLLGVGLPFAILRTELEWGVLVLLTLLLITSILFAVYATERIGDAYHGRLIHAYGEWIRTHPDLGVMPLHADHEPGPKGCRRYGAICYRVRKGRPEFLLVRTKDGKYWTFPKGHIESNEGDRRAAAREAREEAGVEGPVHRRMLTRYLFPAGSAEECDRIEVDAYLLQVKRMRQSSEARKVAWCDTSEAKKMLAADREEPFATEHVRVIDAATSYLTDS